MKRENLFLYAALIILIGALIYFSKTQTKDKQQKTSGGGNMQSGAPQMDSDIEYLNPVDAGEPNISGDMEYIHPGDNEISPGFGIGEGLVGFGRYGSSFMA